MPQPVHFDWKNKAIKDEVSGTAMSATPYKIKDVWTKKSAGTTAKAFTAKVPSHDVVLLLLSR